MVGEASLVIPRFAEHEDAGARGTLENVVSDATGMSERFADESLRGGNRLVIAAFLGLEETVETYHGSFRFGWESQHRREEKCAAFHGDMIVADCPRFQKRFAAI